jgi:prepilin-type N-terminal cleavage/methylation domain-containing protein
MKAGKGILRDTAGFTLIELLIVIVLLGILAAVVVPQVSVSTDDAKLQTLRTDLTQIRSALEIYYAQHTDTYPGANAITGVAAASAAECETAFVQQLTRYTDVDGQVQNFKDATFKYGPYIKGGALPVNPYNDLADVTCDIAQTDITIKDSTGAGTAWKMYAITGVFMAADGAHDTY